MHGKRTVWTSVMVTLAILLAGVAPMVAAQDATPDASPVAGETIVSPSRAEAQQRIREAFPFEEPQQQGGQVIYGSTVDIITSNGFLTSDTATFIITGWIFETLYTASPVDGELIPALADRWEIAPDRITYTFYLNPDAKWHDGTDVTAEDVVFSFDALLNPEAGSAYTSAAAAVIDTYRAIDADTFELKAKEPFVTFLYDINAVIIPKHLWENVPPAEWISDPGSTGQDPSRVVGTGPFKFVEWVQGERVTLARNDDYYGDVPVIDEFVYQILPDPDAQVQALKTGEIDILETIAPAQVEELQQTEGIEVAIYDTFLFVGIHYNLDPAKTTLFQDREVRQALMYALDREAINESIWFGLGEVAIGMQPKLSWAYNPEGIRTHYTFDPDKARDLLAQAGWTDTNGDGTVDKDGQELRFNFLVTEGGGATLEQLYSYLQEAWADIGVGMELEFVGDQEWFDRMTVTHDYEITYWGFQWGIDPNQGYFFRCDAYEGGFNVMRYCNPEYDELDDQQIREFDRARRLELLTELANIVNEDLPVAPIRFPADRTGYSARLHNLFPSGYGAVWSLPYVWVEQ